MINNTEQRNKYIIATAFFKMLEETPVSNISVKEIAERCSISKRTFYNYFSDKYLIAEYFYELYFSKYQKVAFSEYVSAFSRFTHEYHDALLNLFSYRGQNSLVDYIGVCHIDKLCSHLSSNIFYEHDPKTVSVILNKMSQQLLASVYTKVVREDIVTINEMNPKEYLKATLFPFLEPYFSDEPLADGHHILLDKKNSVYQKNFVFYTPDKLN